MKKLNILHILQNSLLEVSGETIRSKYILKHQNKFCNIFAFTSFLFKSNNNLEIIYNIPYFRENPKLSILLRIYTKFINRIKIIIYKLFNINNETLNKIMELPISFFTKYSIRKLVKLFNINIIHQHTQNLIGKYSQEIAEKLNIPYVYEVRGFIEESIIANVKGRKFQDFKLIKFSYNYIKNRETKILKKSDYIITLSEPMKQELIGRNIDKNKIFIIPNCIDPTLEKAYKSNLKKLILKKLIFEDSYVVGCFGTLRWYEGIEILLQSIYLLKKRNINVRLLIVGRSDKSYLDHLKLKIKQLDISDEIIFIGTVPYERMYLYYNMIDAIIIPRTNCRVCQLVTPLKPIDAMYFKTLVIASDLPALRYTIDPYKTGLLFEPENSNRLAGLIEWCIKYPELTKHITKLAFDNVMTNFNWNKIIPQYKEIYKNLINK